MGNVNPKMATVRFGISLNHILQSATPTFFMLLSNFLWQNVVSFLALASRIQNLRYSSVTYLSSAALLEPK